ncbi:GNAT family N-acetyltransferase [Pantoea sp. FN060301]|uniref:GNAT family N-acetyltransferase n=1 Tax=Pantoea sp. FN060301 TaxID=3420380 RepID=UPI003D1859FA
MAVQITAMKESHLAAARELTQRLNWPHREADWQQALWLGEGVVAEENGRLLGTTLFWRWGRDYASLGLVIVADDAQGKGIGKSLVQAALAASEGSSVRLHATEAGKGLYEKLGFVATGEIAQHQCRELAEVVLILPEPGMKLRPARPEDATALTALDTQAHGQHRPRLIAMLLKSTARMLVLEAQGRVSGFACLRRFGHGYVLGPLICRDLPQAKALVSELLSGLQGQFVRMDTDSSYGLSPWLTSLGLIEVDRPTAMILGTPWQPDGMLAFGLMSQAMA